MLIILTNKPGLAPTTTTLGLVAPMTNTLAIEPTLNNSILKLIQTKPKHDDQAFNTVIPHSSNRGLQFNNTLCKTSRRHVDTKMGPTMNHHSQIDKNYTSQTLPDKRQPIVQQTEWVVPTNTPSQYTVPQIRRVIPTNAPSQSPWFAATTASTYASYSSSCQDSITDDVRKTRH